MIAQKSHTCSIDLDGVACTLLPNKALYIEEFRMLVVADVHFGKIGHFRKSGIGLPQNAAQENFKVLHSLIQSLPLDTCIFLGDLLHSDYNAECVLVEKLCSTHDQVEFILTEGNHDTRSADYLHKLDCLAVVNEIIVSNLHFTHIPLENIEKERINIAGHIHPAVHMKGKARQSLRLPCFYFDNKKRLILPAFGNFTGTHIIQPHEGEKVFVIAANKVINVL